MLETNGQCALISTIIRAKCVISREYQHFQDNKQNAQTLNMNKHTGSNQPRYGHILKYIGLLGGVQGLNVLLAVVRNKCAAILIGAVGIGTLDLYNRTVEFISNALNLGIPFCAIRRISQLYEQGDEDALQKEVCSIRMWSQWTGAVAFLVTLIAAPLISYSTFRHWGQTLQFMLLAPLVTMAILTGCELAILKGIRQLRQIASISSLAALVATFGSVACYLLLGLSGIIPSLLVTVFIQFLLTVHASGRFVRYQIVGFSSELYAKGLPTIRLGISFVLAGIFGTGAEMLIRIFIIQQTGTLAVAGLYAAGYVLCITYARIIFVAMDADYFPRLSAVCNQNLTIMNSTINKQIDVCVLLMAPFLVVFITLMPVIIRTIYTESFNAVVPMAICASFYMFFKAVAAPIAYLPLAGGQSKLYLIMEFAYDGIFVLLVMLGFYQWGLPGAGCALSLANLLDVLLVTTVYRHVYKFRMSFNTLKNILCQGICVAVSIVAAFALTPGWRYAAGACLLCFSATLSCRLLNLSIKKLRMLFQQTFRKKRTS